MNNHEQEEVSPKDRLMRARWIIEYAMNAEEFDLDDLWDLLIELDLLIYNTIKQLEGQS